MNPGREGLKQYAARGGAAVLALARSTPASAELTVEITEGVTDPIPIAIVPSRLVGVLIRRLPTSPISWRVTCSAAGDSGPWSASDMVDLPTKASEVVPDDWRMLRNDFVVVGELEPQQSSVQYLIRYGLVNVLNGQKLLEYSQPATMATLRREPSRCVRARSREAHRHSGRVLDPHRLCLGVRSAAQCSRYQLVVADADGVNPRIVAQSTGTNHVASLVARRPESGLRVI